MQVMGYDYYVKDFKEKSLSHNECFRRGITPESPWSEDFLRQYADEWLKTAGDIDIVHVLKPQYSESGDTERFYFSYVLSRYSRPYIRYTGMY